MNREDLEIKQSDGLWYVEHKGERVSPYSVDKADAYRYIDTVCPLNEEEW